MACSTYVLQWSCLIYLNRLAHLLWLPKKLARSQIHFVLIIQRGCLQDSLSDQVAELQDTRAHDMDDY